MSGMDRAHIWALRAPSIEAADALFAESGDGEFTPLNAFAASQNEVFVDHDFLYVEHFGSLGLKHGLEAAQVPEVHRAPILEAWDSQDLDGFQAYIAGDEEDFSTPQSCSIGSCKVHYLGAFEHWSNQDTIS